MMNNVLRGGIPRLRFGSDINVVCDGNSLTFGSGGIPYPIQLQAMDPIDNQLTVVNAGHNGNTWAGMADVGSGRAIDALFDASKRENILIAWEGHNTLHSGETTDQCWDDMALYCSQRMTRHPWVLIILTTLPFRYYGNTQEQVDFWNAEIVTNNARIKDHYRDVGATGYIDLRPSGSAFDFPDYSYETMSALRIQGNPAWTQSESLQCVHLSPAGYGYVAQMVAAGLRRLRAR